MLYQTSNPHGGDLYGRSVELDFSVNTNPLGTPTSVVEAVRAAASSLCRYPDPACRELTEALSIHEGVEADCILCGCGAAELIYSYCAVLGVDCALLVAPSFSEYAAALAPAGISVQYYRLREENGFLLDEDFLKELGDCDCQVVFLCTPNNPTGQLIPPALLREICHICQKRGLRLFVDECFLELSEGGVSLPGCLEDYSGLFLLKAFTKTYGMAGLRLGYCLTADRALLSAMSRMVQPWNVSLPAQMAGVAALQEGKFLEDARALLRTERPGMVEKLEKLGFTVCPSQANFLLLKSRTDLYVPLLERGILIRDCSNYEGLGPGWYRVAVKRPEENQRLLAALAEIAGKI